MNGRHGTRGQQPVAGGRRLVNRAQTDGYNSPRLINRSQTDGYNSPRLVNRSQTDGYSSPRLVNRAQTDGYNSPRPVNRSQPDGYSSPRLFERPIADGSSSRLVNRSFTDGSNPSAFRGPPPAGTANQSLRPRQYGGHVAAGVPPSSGQTVPDLVHLIRSVNGRYRHRYVQRLADNASYTGCTDHHNKSVALPDIKHHAMCATTTSRQEPANVTPPLSGITLQQLTETMPEVVRPLLSRQPELPCSCHLYPRPRRHLPSSHRHWKPDRSQSMAAGCYRPPPFLMKTSYPSLPLLLQQRAVLDHLASPGTCAAAAPPGLDDDLEDGYFPPMTSPDPQDDLLLQRNPSFRFTHTPIDHSPKIFIHRRPTKDHT